MILVLVVSMLVLVVCVVWVCVVSLVWVWGSVGVVTPIVTKQGRINNRFERPNLVVARRATHSPHVSQSGYYNEENRSGLNV